MLACHEPRPRPTHAGARDARILFGRISPCFAHPPSPAATFQQSCFLEAKRRVGAGSLNGRLASRMPSTIPEGAARARAAAYVQSSTTECASACISNRLCASGRNDFDSGGGATGLIAGCMIPAGRCRPRHRNSAAGLIAAQAMLELFKSVDVLNRGPGGHALNRAPQAVLAKATFVSKLGGEPDNCRSELPVGRAIIGIPYPHRFLQRPAGSSAVPPYHFCKPMPIRGADHSSGTLAR